MDSLAKAMDAQVKDAMARLRAMSDEEVRAACVQPTNFGVLAVGELRRRGFP